MNITYRFDCAGLSEGELLHVVDFRGEARLSEPYRYVINLKSTMTDIEIDTLLSNPCTFVLAVDDHEYPVHGVLAEFEQLGQAAEYALYRAVLVPRLWQLSLYRTNEVYLDKTVPEVLELVLEEGGLTSLDYDIDLEVEYQPWEFRCQYGETHLEFINRLMEREGIYYWFEQGSDAEKLVITDSRQRHESIEDDILTFSAPSGMDGDEMSHVHSLVSRTRRMPKKIVLRDFNYEKPTLDVVGEATVDSLGIGEVYVYGENFATPEEGSRLAGIRAQELLCDKHRYIGESNSPRLMPGYTFDLVNHYRGAFNATYLVTSVQHEGTNPSFLTPGGEALPGYYNSFDAIPASAQFRPERRTPKPRFFGTINARIDAEGDGKYAEIDGSGRYRVVLPFDRILRDEGRASHWLRMQTPFAGSDEGMNFPLRKGAEVLLTFIDGDPDRPVISGAVPNGANPNVVNAANQTNNLIKTSSGNKIEMEDQEGANRIKFQTGDNKTYMHMGAPNHDGDGWVIITEGMERKEIQGGQQLTILAAPLDTTTGEKARTIVEANAGSTDLGDTSGKAFTELAAVPDGDKAIQLYELNPPDTSTAATGNKVKGAWEYREPDATSWTAFESGVNAGDKWYYLPKDYQVRFVPDSTLKESGDVTFKYVPVEQASTGQLDDPDSYNFPTATTNLAVATPHQYPANHSEEEGIGGGEITADLIAITALSETDKGLWQYSADNTGTAHADRSWLDFDNSAVSASNALFLEKGNELRFIPHPKTPGSKSVGGGIWMVGLSAQSLDEVTIGEVPSDSCAKITKVLTSDLTLRMETSNGSSYPTGGYVQYMRASENTWHTLTANGGYLSLVTGDSLRFVPEAYAFSAAPAATYRTGLTAGKHTTALTTTGNQTETLKIETDDLIDEQAIHTFTKFDHDGRPNPTTCSNSSTTVTDVTAASATMSRCDELSGQYIISRLWGDQYQYVKGDTFQYNDVNARDFHICNRFEVNISPPQSTGTTAAPAYYDGFSDSDLEALIQKMTLNGFGDTVPTGVKTYSQATPAGSTDQEKWTTLLENAHVIVNHRDEFKTHEGNLYDFGGYWNYNLGNSYAENHLDQGAELNRRHNNLTSGGKSVFNGGGSFSGDVIAGPNSGSISAKGFASMTTDTAQVEKSFTDSYEFTIGVGGTQPAKQLEISWAIAESHSAGDSYEYTYGGEHQETSYDGAGTKRGWERKGGGTWEEKSWNKQGALIHHEVGNSNFGKSSAVFDFGHSNEVSFNAAATSKLSVNTGLSVDISASASMEMNIAAKASLTMDITASVAFSLEGEVGPAWKMELWGADKFTLQGPGTAFTYKKAFEAEIQTLMMEDMRIQMQNENIELKNGSLVVDNEPIAMEVGMEFNL